MDLPSNLGGRTNSAFGRSIANVAMFKAAFFIGALLQASHQALFESRPCGGCAGAGRKRDDYRTDCTAGSTLLHRPKYVIQLGMTQLDGNLLPTTPRVHAIFPAAKNFVWEFVRPSFMCYVAIDSHHRSAGVDVDSKPAGHRRSSECDGYARSLLFRPDCHVVPIASLNVDLFLLASKRIFNRFPVINIDLIERDLELCASLGEELSGVNAEPL